MPITRSAKKALRQATNRTTKNAREKRELRGRLKEFSRSLEGGSKEATGSLLSQVQQSLDKAVRHGIINRNTASRKKSRLMRSAARNKS